MSLLHPAVVLLLALVLSACTTTVSVPVELPDASGAEPASVPVAPAPQPSPVVVTPAPQLPPPVSAPAPTPPATPPATPVSSLLASVQAAVAAGDYERGAAISERALRISPRDAQLWFQLALIRFRQNRLDEAANTARRAQSLAGSNGELQRQIAALLQQISQ